MSSLHLIKSYIRFLWNSNNEYSVHSPFVYDLLTKCFYDRFDYEEYKILKRYREGLLADHSTIEVADFGAGSRVFKSNRRKVSEIAKNAGISSNRAMLLYRLTKYFNPENTLEIGTSVGLATASLSIANPNGKITTLEGCPETASVAKKKFEEFGLKNIQPIVIAFDDFFDYQLPTINYQLVYFDGNHQKEATLLYFEKLLRTATNESVWIFDDIHWSAEMEDAWESIKRHPKVTVTIDTFQWGLVFFRPEQPKEHFVIRC